MFLIPVYFSANLFALRAYTMEELYVYIGSSGLYQLLVFFALLPFGLYRGLDIASQNTLYGVPNHWCMLPYLTNFSLDEQHELARSGLSEDCVYYEFITTNGAVNQTATTECQSWYYADDVFERTAVTEVLYL